MKTITNSRSICFILALCICTWLCFSCAPNYDTYPASSPDGFFDAYTIPDTNALFCNTDVVVIGGGLAGLTAAVTAAQEGKDVTVIEKMPMIGGNAIYSSGTFNAVNPQLQSHYGIEDSVELFIKQTYEGGGEIGNLDLISLLCENADDARSWLEAQGGQWSDNGVYLATGGAWPRSIDAANGANKSLITPLAYKLHKLGGKIIRDYRVIALIRCGSSVIGARAIHTQTGEEHMFFAENGVVLATGGFGSNLDMVHQYCPYIPESVLPETTTAAIGDGILLALGSGAALTDMEYVQMVPGAEENCVYFTNEIDSAIYVNQNGQRFASEQSPNSQLCLSILEQPGGIAYAIFDSSTITPGFIDTAGRGEAEFRALAKQGLCGYGETLDELADSIGIDPEALRQSVDSFNRIVDGQESDPFGRELFYKKLGNAPFYASIRTARIHYTMGGLRINTSAAVLREDGSAIDGLYACGEVTGGVHGSNHVNGNALADCVVFGRIAGKSVCS